MRSFYAREFSFALEKALIAEREACAKIVDSWARVGGIVRSTEVLRDVAKEIRARGKKEVPQMTYQELQEIEKLTGGGGVSEFIAEVRRLRTELDAKKETVVWN